MLSSATAASFAASIFGVPFPSSVSIEPDASNASRIFGAPVPDSCGGVGVGVAVCACAAATNPPARPTPKAKRTIHARASIGAK